MCPACVAEAAGRERLTTEREELEVPHPLQIRETPELNRKYAAARTRDPGGVAPGSMSERQAIRFVDAKRAERKRGTARGRLLSSRREDGQWVNTYAKPRPGHELVWQLHPHHDLVRERPSGPIEGEF